MWNENHDKAMHFIFQLHEQLNKMIKGDGGPVGLFNNVEALQRLGVVAPEMARLVSEFEAGECIRCFTSYCKWHKFQISYVTIILDIPLNLMVPQDSFIIYLYCVGVESIPWYTAATREPGLQVYLSSPIST